MKAKVTRQGVLVPKTFLKGIEEVEIRQENGFVVVEPITGDPIHELGKRPIADELEDATENHDQYIYGK